MPQLTLTDDVTLHYEDRGSGRPIVLIHGWPLSGQAWEPQIGPLVDAGFRVVTYDRRGFGASSHPTTGYDYDTLSGDLAQLLEHLDLREVTLVGFSMGGGEVVRYLGVHGSDRIAQAVLASSVPPALHVDDGGALDDATIAEFEQGVRDDRLAFLDQFTRDFFTAGDELTVSQDQRDEAKALAVPASPEATLACIGAFGRTDFREDVTAIDVPTLVIHGDSDGIVPFEASGQRSAAAIDGAELHTIAGGPHGINVSHAEEVNRVLIEFLAG